MQIVCKAESNSVSDYLDYADRVHFPGFTVCLPAQDNWAEAVEREPGFQSLIGVMFSRAWSCSSPCTGLSGAGPVVGAGRVGHRYQACREMICSPHPLPLGPSTVTHGTLVTRSLHCCGTTGGAGLIIRREDIFKKNLKENLISNHIYSRKTRFLISRSFLSKFVKGKNT